MSDEPKPYAAPSAELTGNAQTPNAENRSAAGHRASAAAGQPGDLGVRVRVRPCVNLLVLLMLNGRATGRLREAGFKVGQLGADPSQFD
jgi:hypothetical protein